MAETLGSLLVRIGVDISDFEQKMNQTNKGLRRLGQQIQETGAAIGVGFGVAGAAIAVGLGMAVKKAADFDAQMSRVGAIAGATGDDLQKLRQTALDLGASTSKSASEVAEGMELMAAMGFEVNEVIAAMPGVISAAEASGEEMALVADTVSAALNSFGLEAKEASRVADVLAQAANDSAAGIEDMQYSFKYAAPLAKQLGISLEELAAATEIMANAGMRGEQAGTTLRMAMIRLSDPPKKAREALEDLGVSIKDAHGNFRPFSDIVDQLRDGLKGMSNAEKVAALSAIFGAEAVSGMLNIIDAGPEKLNKLTKSLQNSAGASAKTAAQMKNNLAGALQELQGAFETAQISIGESLTPAVRKVAEALKGLFDWFNQLSEPTKRFIAIGLAVTAALLLLTAVVGVATMAFGALATAEWSVIMPVLGIIAAVTAAIVALVAIGAALVQAYNKFTWFRTLVDTVWNGIKTAFMTAFTFIKNIVTIAMTEISSFFGAKLAEIKAFWDENGTQIMAIINAVWGGFVKPYLLNAMKMITSAMGAAWAAISTAVKIAWTIIKTVISNAITLILGVVKAGLQIMNGDWKGAFNTLKSTALKIWGNIKSGIRNIVNDLIDGAKSWGKNMVSMFAAGIANSVGLVAKAAKSIAAKAKEYLGFASPTKRGPASNSDKWAPNFMDMFSSGIQKGIPQLKMAVSDVALTLSDTQNPSGQMRSGNTYNLNINNSGQPLNAYDLLRKMKAVENLYGF
jgi:TP901 family phage tail tape measure protein